MYHFVDVDKKKYLSLRSYELDIRVSEKNGTVEPVPSANGLVCNGTVSYVP